MTKKELLQAIDEAVEATKVHVATGLESTGIAQAEKDKQDRLNFLQQVRQDIDNLLKFLDDATDLGSLSTFAQCKNSKSLALFLKTGSFSDVHKLVDKMQGSLESFVVESGKQLEKIQDVQNQCQNIIDQQKEKSVTRQKHNKCSRMVLWVATGVFVSIVIVLLAVYFVTMEEFNEHAIVDFVLLGIGLGVDIFALAREIHNDKIQKRDDDELATQCKKLVDDLTVINQTVINVDKSTHQEVDGSNVVNNYGTVEDKSPKIYIGKMEKSQVGDGNTQINLQLGDDHNG